MQPLWIATAALSGLMLGRGDEPQVKLADCPPAVRKTFQAEAGGAKIPAVTRQKEGDEEAVYWADVAVGGRMYAIGVQEDGTLVEMILVADDADLPLDRCPAAVQVTFRDEAFGQKIDTVGRDLKYGEPIYEAVVDHKGKTYEIVVAEDGTLVEKVLVVDDEDVDLSACPAAVKGALQEHAKGGVIRDIIRSTGLGRPTYEAEIEIKGKVYLVEVAEGGLLLSKSLEAAAD